MATRRWTFETLGRNIHRFNVDLERVGDEQWFLLQSDVHWDNPKCDRDLLIDHWKEAKDKDAPILDNGDFFCAMQGKYDKRANKGDLRPEHQVPDYFDSLVTTAADAMQPFKDLFTVRGRGNHETAILKNHETDLTERLAERMRMSGATSCTTGGYSGFVVFQVAANRKRFPHRMFYHHGWGGGGPVTKGTIQANRMQYADADLLWSGHTHDSWLVPYMRVRLNQDNSQIVHAEQLHFRTAGYKCEWGDGYGGWVIEKGHAPKPIGAAWLRFKYKGTNHQSKPEITVDVIQAK